MLTRAIEKQIEAFLKGFRGVPFLLLFAIALCGQSLYSPSIVWRRP